MPIPRATVTIEYGEYKKSREIIFNIDYHILIRRNGRSPSAYELKACPSVTGECTLEAHSFLPFHLREYPNYFITQSAFN